MHVWMLLMMVSAGGHTVPARMAFNAENLCVAEGKRADKVAGEIKGVKVKWTCRPAEPPSPDEQEN